VALLGTIGPALVFLGAPAYWEKALQGAIILIAVAWSKSEIRNPKSETNARTEVVGS
jgi:rhamnose transport system permease protein